MSTVTVEVRLEPDVAAPSCVVIEPEPTSEQPPRNGIVRPRKVWSGAQPPAIASTRVAPAPAARPKPSESPSAVARSKTVVASTIAPVAVTVAPAPGPGGDDRRVEREHVGAGDADAERGAAENGLRVGRAVVARVEARVQAGLEGDVGAGDRAAVADAVRADGRVEDRRHERDAGREAERAGDAGAVGARSDVGGRLDVDLADAVHRDLVAEVGARALLGDRRRDRAADRREQADVDGEDARVDGAGEVHGHLRAARAGRGDDGRGRRAVGGAVGRPDVDVELRVVLGEDDDAGGADRADADLVDVGVRDVVAVAGHRQRARGEGRAVADRGARVAGRLRRRDHAGHVREADREADDVGLHGRVRGHAHRRVARSRDHRARRDRGRGRRGGAGEGDGDADVDCRRPGRRSPAPSRSRRTTPRR